MRDRAQGKPAEELAPPMERVLHWGRELLHMLAEHERIALQVKATPWFVAPMSRPMEELAAALVDLEAEDQREGR